MLVFVQPLMQGLLYPVWGAAQIKAMKKVTGTLRIDLAFYRGLEAFTNLVVTWMLRLKRELNRGRRTVESLETTCS